MSYPAWQTFFNLPRKDRDEVFVEMRKFVDGREKLMTDTTQRMETFLIDWFHHNYKKLGYDRLIKRTNRCPDYIMERDGVKLKVEIENTSADFLSHGHKTEDVQILLCYEKTADVRYIKTEEMKDKLVTFKDIDEKLTELIKPYWIKHAIERHRRRYG